MKTQETVILNDTTAIKHNANEFHKVHSEEDFNLYTCERFFEIKENGKIKKKQVV